MNSESIAQMIDEANELRPLGGVFLGMGLEVLRMNIKDSRLTEYSDDEVFNLVAVLVDLSSEIMPTFYGELDRRGLLPTNDETAES